MNSRDAGQDIQQFRGVIGIRRGLRVPSHTRVHREWSRQLPFPAVTVCNNNPLRFPRLSKGDLYYAGHWLGLLLPNRTARPLVSELLRGDEPRRQWFRKLADFRLFLPPRHFEGISAAFMDRLGHQLEDMLLSCKYRGELCGPHNFSSVSGPLREPAPSAPSLSPAPGVWQLFPSPGVGPQTPGGDTSPRGPGQNPVLGPPHLLQVMGTWTSLQEESSGSLVPASLFAPKPPLGIPVPFLPGLTPTPHPRIHSPPGSYSVSGVKGWEDREACLKCGLVLFGKLNRKLFKYGQESGRPPKLAGDSK